MDTDTRTIDPRPQEVRKTTREQRAGPAGERAGILVVDDLPEKLLVYRTILEDMDVDLVTADSGHQALKEVLKREFAVILMDVSMPGMDGFEAAALIRQRKRSALTPIIFLTAFTDEMRVAQGYASGAVDYLPTPVVPEILRAKVQVFVELFQMRRISASQARETARRAAAEEAARRSEFLATAGTALMRTIDLETMLSTLAGIGVPFLADLSVLCIADSNGRVPRMETVWSDPSAPPFERERRTPTCPYPWLVDVLERTLLTNEFRIMTAMPSSTEANRGLWPDRAGGHALILPLSVREKVYAVFALLRPATASVFAADEVSLARELAAKAGIALENAMLVRSIQEADQRKDEFLGMLAHELRNPLAPIRNAIELLQVSGAGNGSLEQARSVIDRQVAHMSRLVDDLLDATRIARGKVLLRRERCDLSSIVYQITEDHRSIFDAAGIHLRLKQPTEVIWVQGDPTRIAQAVGNLLHNAQKFTERSGSVSVTLATSDAGSTATITVRDSGIGIDPRTLPHVFDMFRQAEQGLDRTWGGLGLGLTLVKGLAELHGGSVSAASAGLGQGAEFTIQLPVDTEPVEVALVKEASPPSPTAHYRILVVDDNTDAAETICALLGRDGHQVRTASDGNAGLQLARTFLPEVVLCDIGLPGMDGYAVAKAVRAEAPIAKAYLIALTGYGRDEDMQRSRTAGFDLHLTKPIGIAQLRNAIAGIAERRSIPA